MVHLVLQTERGAQMNGRWHVVAGGILASVCRNKNCRHCSGTSERMYSALKPRLRSGVARVKRLWREGLVVNVGHLLLHRGPGQKAGQSGVIGLEFHQIWWAELNP